MALDDEFFEEINDLVRGYESEHSISSSACGILVDSKLVWSNYSGHRSQDNEAATDSESQFRITSMTKSFTAAAVLKLRDQGVLHLEDPVEKYIPTINFKYPKNSFLKITVKHLLNMTAGLPNCDPWSDRNLDMSQPTIEKICQDGITLACAPGLNAIYSSFGYAILGQLVRNILGENLQDYVSQHILAPLKMQNTSWEPLSDNFVKGYRSDTQTYEPYQLDGTIAPMGGLWTTVEDLATWVTFYLDSFSEESTQYETILSSQSRREQQQISSVYSNALGESNHCYQISYGMGLGVELTSSGLRVAHMGGQPGYGSGMGWYPSHSIGFIICGNSTYGIQGKFLVKILDLIIKEVESDANVLAADTKFLEDRAASIRQVIETWAGSDDAFDSSIFASNFFDDFSLEQRQEALRKRIQGKPFTIESETVSAVETTFILDIEGNDAPSKICMVVNPEYPAKVQVLKLLE